MRPALKTREFLSQYQQKPRLDFSSRPVGLVLEIKRSRQTSDTFDATTRNHLLQVNGYNAAQDFITRQNQALAQNSATPALSSRIDTE